MELKRIIKEEINDFDWAEEHDPTSISDEDRKKFSSKMVSYLVYGREHGIGDGEGRVYSSELDASKQISRDEFEERLKEWAAFEAFIIELGKLGETDLINWLMIKTLPQSVSRPYPTILDGIKEYGFNVNSSKETKRLYDKFYKSQSIIKRLKSKLFGESLSEIVKEEIFNEAKIKVGKDEYEKLFEDKTVLVLKPLTHQASCKYGSGTRWCVTARETDKWWKHYTKKTALFVGTNWQTVIGEVEEELKRSWLDKLLGKPVEVVKKEVKEFVEEFPVGILYFVILKKRIVDYEYDKELKYNKPIYETADPKDPMNKLALLYRPQRADFGDMTLFDKTNFYTYIGAKLDASHNNMSIFNSLDQKVTLREVSKVLDGQFSTPFAFIEEDFQKERDAIDKILKNVLDKVYPLFGGEGSKHKGDYKVPTTWVTSRGDNELQSVKTRDMNTKDGHLTWNGRDAVKYRKGGM